MEREQKMGASNFPLHTHPPTEQQGFRRVLVPNPLIALTAEIFYNLLAQFHIFLCQLKRRGEREMGSEKEIRSNKHRCWPMGSD